MNFAVARKMIVFLAVLGTAFNLHPQTPRAAEYEVKAVYLVNFVKFIEWPARTLGRGDDPFSICVLGQDPFGPALDTTVAGEKIDRHPLAAHRISNVRDTAGCRVLFIGVSDASQIEAALASLEGASILTVSDAPRFLSQGGMIGFVLDGNRVRFELNLTVVKMAGLNVRSELLRVAAAVRGAP